MNNGPDQNRRNENVLNIHVHIVINVNHITIQ